MRIIICRNYLILLFGIVLFSCKESVITSEQSEKLTPGKRDYSWKVDDINISFYDWLGYLWGSSSKDVWAIGTAGMWRYDGEKWSEYGHFSGFNWTGILGFSSSNIWAITSVAGRIYHYDGNNWSMMKEINLPGYSLTYLEDIWGDSPNNIYVVGGIGNPNVSPKAIILRYNGSNWSIVDIPNIKVGFNKIVRDSKGTGKFYLRGMDVVFDTTKNPVFVSFSDKLYEYDGQNKIQEINYPAFGYPYLSEVNGRAYFTFSKGKSIWKYSNNKFDIWRDFSNTDFFIGQLFGNNEADLFCYSTSNKVYGKEIVTHYNSIDLFPVFESNDILGNKVIGDDIFLTLIGNQRAIVRGSLISK